MKKTRFLHLRQYRFKLILVIILLFLAIASTFRLEYVSASSTTADYDSINSNINDIIASLDLSDLQDIVNNLNDLDLFGSSISDKISDIVSGEYFTNYASLAEGLLSIVFVDIRSFLPILFSLVAIGLLCNMLLSFKSGSQASTNEIIHFVSFSVMVVIVLIAFKNILFLTDSTLNLILRQMQIVFPILITLLASIGSVTAISIYNPLVAVLTTGVGVVFEKFLYPIFIVIFLFTIIGNLTDTVKLGKLTNFLTSTFKWTVGIVFTIFMGFMSIQGITAGKFDSVGIKATKFAMKSYIPIIGSYISEGMDFLILGSVLVKNTVGLIGVMVLFVTILSPIVNIIVFKLGLQLASGILEMTGNNKMSSFLTSCSKILILPIVLILGVAFMYVITIALIMCTANLI